MRDYQKLCDGLIEILNKYTDLNEIQKKDLKKDIKEFLSNELNEKFNDLENKLKSVVKILWNDNNIEIPMPTWRTTLKIIKEKANKYDKIEEIVENIKDFKPGN